MFAVVIRDDSAISQSVEIKVNWVDQRKNLLKEYKEIDRHTM